MARTWNTSCGAARSAEDTAMGSTSSMATAGVLDVTWSSTPRPLGVKWKLLSASSLWHNAPKSWLISSCAALSFDSTSPVPCVASWR